MCHGLGWLAVRYSLLRASRQPGDGEWRIPNKLRPALLDRLFAPVTTLPGIGPQLGKLVERAAGAKV